MSEGKRKERQKGTKKKGINTAIGGHKGSKEVKITNSGCVMFVCVCACKHVIAHELCVHVCVVARAPDAQMMNGLLSQHRQCSDTEDLRSHGSPAHT